MMPLSKPKLRRQTRADLDAQQATERGDQGYTSYEGRERLWLVYRLVVDRRHIEREDGHRETHSGHRCVRRR